MPSTMNLLKRLTETREETFRAVVSAEESGSETTEFYVKDLAGYGDDYFNTEWWVQVVETADAAAPEGQWRNVKTVGGYISDTGKFVMESAFGADVNTGDNLLFIHEYQYALGARDDTAPGMDVAPADIDSVIMHVKALRETVGQEPADNDDSLHTIVGQRDGTIPAMNAAVSDTSTLVQQTKAILERVGKTPADADDSLHTSLGQRDTAATADDLSDIATTTAQSKLRRLLLRFSSDAFSAQIQGGARTDVETMFGQMATYFVASGGAFADKVNNKTLRTNLEDILQDFFLTVGCDGANEFKTTIQAATPTQTSIEAALDALATYFVGSGAAMTTNINGTARANLNLVFGDLKDILWGGNGIAGYPAAANIGDGVSIAESIRAILTSIVGGDDYDAYTNISNTANASLNAVAQKFATTIGIENTATFDPAMFGGAQSTIEAAFAAVGTALGAEFDGTPDLYDLLYTGITSSAITNNFDGGIMEVLKAGLEKTTAGAYDPDNDSNEAIRGVLDSLTGANGIFHEQDSTAINITVADAAEHDIFNLATASTRYILRNLRLKLTDPGGVNTVTIRLKEEINDVVTTVDDLVINTGNHANYWSLMDMFGIDEVAGDKVQLTYQASAGTPTLTGQYAHAKTNV